MFFKFSSTVKFKLSTPQLINPILILRASSIILKFWRLFMQKLKEAVHFTTRNRVPHNKQSANRACSVVAVPAVPTATSGQYYPVRLSRSVSKRLILCGPEKLIFLVPSILFSFRACLNLQSLWQNPITQQS